MLMQTSDQCARSTNRFLHHLSGEDRALISQDLERVTLTAGFPLLSANLPIAFIHFPETAIVSIRDDCGSHLGIETAVVGSEGLVGWSGLSGCDRSAQNAIIEMHSGTAMRISMHDMQRACASSHTLLRAVMRFVEVVIGQMARAIVSHLRDTVERRVCRWLLMRHDRMLGDQLLIKHDDVSAKLGVRRASITDCLHVLESDHLVRCHRGRIIVRNRVGLEALAGESYGGAEAHYRTMIGPFGRNAVSKYS
jgi:CRP-like cAMP-binding protein